MATFFSIPVGIFFLLWALLWQPKPKADEADLADILTEEEANQIDPDQMRKYLRLVAMRTFMFILSVVCVIGGFVQGIGGLGDWSAFGVFVGVYAGCILILQRAERTSKLIVYYTMAFAGYLIWQFANFRDLNGEHDWGLLGAVALNFAFWYVVGRYHTPEDTIEVLT